MTISIYFLIGLILGLFIGANFGVIVVAMLAASSRRDAWHGECGMGRR